MEKTSLKIFHNILSWISENKKEFFLLLAVLLIGAFFRLYKISEYMTFLGDEGRDAIIVRRLLVYGDPILIGPGTSIGNMYLGPLYYYFIAPALFLAGFSPVGPSVLIALVGVATIFFVWFVCREWFSSKYGGLSIAGLAGAVLYAISPTVIIYSRSSWNPNVMPFFALLSIYGITRVWKNREWKWLLIIGVSLAFILQSHYLGLLLIPTLAIYWTLTYREILKEKKSELRNFLRASVLGLSVFLFLMSPLVIFDARHGWMNAGAMKKFFTERQTTVSVKPWNSIPKIAPIFEKATIRLLTGRNEKMGLLVSFILFASFLVVIYRVFQKGKSGDTVYFIIILVWLSVALIGLGLYKQEIYDHYYGFFFPAPFILIGAVLEKFYRSNKWGKIIFFIIFLSIVFSNFYENPLKYPSNKQLQRSILVSDKIISESQGKKFNLAVVAERNYEDGYQYFLELKGAPVLDIDAQRPDETITKQLFVVCEMPKEKCSPTTNAKAEVANFGWSKVENEWEVFGVTIFKLVHSK